MQTYAEVLIYGIPFFILLILIEFVVSRYRGISVLRSFDTVSSLSSGITNVVKDVLGLAVVIVSYEWMVNHLAFIEIEVSVIAYILAFIGLDFAGYWGHRFEHTINLLWNRHVIHHSSEEFNLACALRQNVSAIFGIFFFLYIPMALIGVPADVVAVVAPLHLFAQFWYHTRLIDRLGFLENLIVTPSHHRVHHAINDVYLDRNFSQVFIVWDKLFGTFQEELKNEPPVYGVKNAVRTWNPFLINFQHLALLISDIWKTKNWKDKFRIFFMPTGWRPTDRIREAPVQVIEDVHNQQKYNTDGSFWMHIWIWIQLIVHVVFLLYFFQRIGDFELIYMIGYGLFLYLSIFSYTSMMDRSNWIWFFELFKIIIGIGLYLQIGSWYRVGERLMYGDQFFFGYLIVSLVLNIYFTKEKI